MTTRRTGEDGLWDARSESEILSDDEHRKFQMLLGMLNWIVSIGRFDVAYATASLSRFSACPRKGHLERREPLGYLVI